MNWTRYRDLFPVTDHAIQLDALGGSPISTRVEEALVRWAQRAARITGPPPADPGETTRTRAAELLDARAGEIALPRDAREGLYRVLQALDWKAGDAVVLHGISRAALPGAAALFERGVEIHPATPTGQALRDDFLDDAPWRPRLRLLVLPSVDPVNGARLDLGAAGERCRRHGALLAVDASASLGSQQLRPEREGIDFLVADGHRYLASAPGCGLLFVTRFLHDTMRASPLFRPGGPPGARRLDCALGGSPTVAALGAALALALEVGPARIEVRVRALAERLADGLAARQFPVSTPRDLRKASGAVHFEVPGRDPGALCRRLRERGIRIARAGTGLRASPHAYNTDAEIDALLRAL